MSMLEAQCTRCDGIFVPHGTDMEDLIHTYVEMTDSECGGIGVIQGQWAIPGTSPLTIDDALTPQEKHGLENPHCSDPDCEFHHPELIEL